MGLIPVQPEFRYGSELFIRLSPAFGLHEREHEEDCGDDLWVSIFQPLRFLYFNFFNFTKYFCMPIISWQIIESRPGHFVSHSSKYPPVFKKKKKPPQKKNGPACFTCPSVSCRLPVQPLEWLFKGICNTTSDSKRIAAYHPLTQLFPNFPIRS